MNVPTIVARAARAAAKRSPRAAACCLHSSASSSTESTSTPSSGGAAPWREVEIPVPWGHVSGKWWGRTDVVPVIALHGIEDNSASFDALVPLLTDVPAVLALDMPGHGLSSHLPAGMVYTHLDFVITLRRVVKHFGWQRVSLIAHSWGSMAAHVYAGSFPEEVDRLVSMECGRSLLPNFGARGLSFLPQLASITKTCVKSDRQVEEGRQPPAYTREQLIQGLMSGSEYSSATAEAARLLGNRGSAPHPSEPGCVYFSRDPKLRFGEYNRPDEDLLLEMARHVRCHVLTVLAKNGIIYKCSTAFDGAPFRGLMECGDIIGRSGASHQLVDVDGTHHAHLNTPENVAPAVNRFLGDSFLAQQEGAAQQRTRSAVAR